MQNNIINNNKVTKSRSEKVRDFLRYNNSVPLFIAVAMVISGSAFASTPAGQQALSTTLVGAQTKVISVDNTLIANTDLTTWTPRARVTGMKEDVDNFYVDYVLSTIDIKDYRWQYVDKAMTLKVSKEVLKDYASLSDYVKFELKQNIVAENERLVRTQEIEKKNITQMTTVTSYSGLAGLVLDENTIVAEPVLNTGESLTPAQVPPPTVPQIPTSNEQVPTGNEQLPVNEIIPVDSVVSTTTIPTDIASSTSATSTATTTQPLVDTSVIDNATTTPIVQDPVVPADAASTTTEIVPAPVEEVVVVPEIPATVPVENTVPTEPPTPVEAPVAPTETVTP